MIIKEPKEEIFNVTIKDCNGPKKLKILQKTAFTAL